MTQWLDDPIAQSTIMTTPPSVIPAKHRVRRKRRGVESAPTVALTLVAASYNHDDGPVIVLEFDRLIDLGSMDGAQIVVDDADDQGLKFTATGAATMENPSTVSIGLVEAG